MPIGKDSIRKRVAKATEEETVTAPVEAAVDTAKGTAPETVVSEPEVKESAPATPAKKTTTTKKSSTKTTSTAAKKPTAKKATSTATKKPAAQPATAVMANVSPEVVEKVTGHAEGTPSIRVQLTEKLPIHHL